MSRDNVIRWAQEIGLIHKADDEQFLDMLERFASIAEAEGALAERRKHQTDIERWKGEAATAEKWRGLALSKDGDGRTVQRIQQEAVTVEREACAMVAEGFGQTRDWVPGSLYGNIRAEVAAKIRARGKPALKAV